MALCSSFDFLLVESEIVIWDISHYGEMKGHTTETGRGNDLLDHPIGAVVDSEATQRNHLVFMNHNTKNLCGIHDSRVFDSCLTTEEKFAKTMKDLGDLPSEMKEYTTQTGELMTC
jgi:hypothetical protein